MIDRWFAGAILLALATLLWLVATMRPAFFKILFVLEGGCQ